MIRRTDTVIHYMHEYGHYLQSQEYGWGYLFSVGIPSLYSAWTADKFDNPPFSTHALNWFERSANRKARDYFGEKYGVDWNTKYIPWFWNESRKNRYRNTTYKDLYPL